ncbi:MAG: OPT/YSL family transporter [Parcubacteria group bacterium]|nr:OPT/YSL family transporter [Parcubacteria group bacterium]
MTGGLTVRALIWGFITAVVMCGVNSYFILKVGIIEEGFVVTFLLFYVGVQIIKIFVRQGKITKAEATMVGTMGSAGGALSFIANVFAALKMAGHTLTWWEMTAFTILVSLGGLLMAIPFRHLYVVKDPLPWPTAKVAVSSIEAVLSSEKSIQPKVLLVGSIMAFAWILGIGFEFFPGATLLPFGLGNLGVAVAWSPFILGAGYLVGMRVGWGFGIGAIILAFMAPHMPLTEDGSLLAPHRYVWPGIAALVACGVTGLVLKWKTIWNALVSLNPRGMQGISDEDRVFSGRTLKLLTVIVFLITVVGLRYIFHINMVASSLGLLAAYTILNAISNRAAGETAFNPVRVMGVALMLIFAALGANDSWSTIIGAGIASAGIGATCILVQDNYVGRVFKVPARQQFLGQALVLGPTAFVCAGVFLLADSTYGVGSRELPAAVAVLWSKVAQILSGEAQFEPFAMEAMIIGTIGGVILAISDEVANRRMKAAKALGKFSLWRFTPHSLGITLGMLLPICYDLAFFVGALVLCWLVPRSSSILSRLLNKPKLKVGDEVLTGVAAAGIVGEGLANLIVAGLAAAGIIGGNH